MRKLGVVAPVLGFMVLLLSWAPASAQQTITVTIGPGRDENTGTGTATLTAMGAQTQVVVRAAGTNPEMLGHIHADACPGVGAVVFPLTNPVNGQSTTMINQPLAQVLAQGRSINLHKSPQQGGIYVGCGNLAAAAGAAQVPGALPRTGDAASLAPLVSVLGVGLLGVGFALRRRVRR
jgi:LPXTG-motif cell wall-anchored protein